MGEEEDELFRTTSALEMKSFSKLPLLWLFSLPAQHILVLLFICMCSATSEAMSSETTKAKSRLVFVSQILYLVPSCLCSTNITMKKDKSDGAASQATIQQTKAEPSCYLLCFVSTQTTPNENVAEQSNPSVSDNENTPSGSVDDLRV